MRKFAFYILISFTLGVCACSSDDNDAKPIDPVEPVKPELGPLDTEQPSPSDEDIDLGNVVGFWDFEGNTKNSVEGECYDFVVNKPKYDGGALDLRDYAFPEKYTDLGANLLRIMGGQKQNKGLHQRRYFSGAVRFMLDDDIANYLSILAFGYSYRFLQFELIDKQVAISLNEGCIIKESNVYPDLKKWNVLYFRYEDFTGDGNVENGTNKLYYSINNEEEKLLNLGEIHINQIAQDFDITANFANWSSGKVFDGKVDWFILSVGRMTPGNAQYLVNMYKKK